MQVITAYLTRQVAMGNREKVASTITSLWREAKARNQMSYVTQNMYLKKMEIIRDYHNHGGVYHDEGHDEYYVKTNPESTKGFGARGSANEVCRWREDASLMADQSAPLGQIWQSKWWFNQYQSVTTSNMVKCLNVNPGGTTVVMDWTAFTDADTTLVSTYFPNLTTIKDIAKGITFEDDVISPDILISTVPHFATISLANDYRTKTSGYFYNNDPTIDELEEFLAQNLEDIPSEE